MRKIISYFFIILLLINVLYVLSGVLNFPMRSMDSYSDWMLKAKVLYLAGHNFPTAFFQNWGYMASHMQYPLGLPYLFAGIYSIFGLHETFALLLSPCLYVAILCMTYSTLKTLRCTPLQALILTYVYSMFSPLLGQAGRGHAGNADIYVVFFVWTSIRVYVSSFSAKKRAILITLCAMLASQIKLEGVFLSVLLFFLPNLSWKTKSLTLIFSVIPIVIWSLVVHQFGFAGDIVYRVSSTQELFTRGIVITSGFMKEFLNLHNWYIFWPFFILSLWIKTPTQSENKIIRSLLIAVLISFALFFNAYLFAYFAKTEINIAKYVGSSADRVLFQLSPYFFLIFSLKIKRTFGLFIKPSHE